jgi:tRNA U34 2-thiouridine synthase MnmA/TrmU
MVKALGLFSGGLDSILAAKIIKKQGIKVELVNFYTPFFPPKNAIEMAKQIDIPIKDIDVTRDYLNMLRKPKHGYGSEMNPCIDCKIFMLKKARQHAKKIGAKFIFTGEVLGERPMSQNKNALQLIQKEAGFEILRPLSARLLPITEAERKWVDRSKLMGISGRGRHEQIKLAKEFGIDKYPTPAGGCLLTDKEFARKISYLLKKKNVTKGDLELLKVGRHFRYKNNKIIVGRNEEENKKLLCLKQKTDYIFEVPDVGSPITILQGPKTKDSIEKAAQLTARYSDSKDNKTIVKYGNKKLIKNLSVSILQLDEINKLRV